MSDSAPDAPARRLPLRRVIVGAFVLTWQHRAPLFRATALPLLAVIACSLAADVLRFNQSVAGSWALFFLYSVATSWLAVVVHRLVLLETSESNGTGVHAVKRVGLFLAVLIGVWVLFAGLVLLIVSGLLNIFLARYVPAGGERAELPVPIEWVNALAYVLAFWVVARVSLVFPAIAIDRAPDFIAAWRASKRNGWRLAVVVGALPWSLERLSDLLYRDGATSVEFALTVVLTAFFTVIQVVVLSLSFWELTSPAPPPTDPPA